jgi:lipopolysaccharide export system protein LptA
VKTRTTIPHRGPDLSGRRTMARGAGRKIFAVAAVTALLGVLAATDALAQKNQGSQNQGPPNALQGFSQNRGQPVKIESDKLDVRSKDNVATFTGNVHVTQGDTELHSKVLVVFYVDTSKPSPTPVNAMKAARGGVLVTQKEQNAAGDTGIFDMQSNSVTLNGNVVVTRGKDVVRGQRLVVDLNTGVSHIDGGRVDMLLGSAPNGEVALPGPQPGPATGTTPGPTPRPLHTN